MTNDRVAAWNDELSGIADVTKIPYYIDDAADEVISSYELLFFQI